jgi:hypothetical protein
VDHLEIGVASNYSAHCLGNEVLRRYLAERLAMARKLLLYVFVFASSWSAYYLAKLLFSIIDPCRTYSIDWLNWLNFVGVSLAMLYYTLCPLTMIYINPDLGLLCKRLLVDNVVVFVKMIFH